MFEVDPSKGEYKSMFKNFINYLYSKTMVIDVWDADNLMLYGSVKINLK